MQNITLLSSREISDVIGRMREVGEGYQIFRLSMLRRGIGSVGWTSGMVVCWVRLVELVEGEW